MEQNNQSAMYKRAGPKPYMNEDWWLFLPLYIFVIFSIISVLGIVFSNQGTAGVLLSTVFFAILMGILLWWLCDIGQLAWAWFFLLLPLIVSMLASTITMGIVGARLVQNGMR